MSCVIPPLVLPLVDDRTAESSQQLHPGCACSCAYVAPGRAQHRFECLDLCVSRAMLWMVHMHPGDTSSERDDWSERHLCPLWDERCFHQIGQVPSCQVAKQEAVLTVPSALHRGVHQPLELGYPHQLKIQLPFLRPLLHDLVSKLVALAWGEMVQRSSTFWLSDRV